MRTPQTCSSASRGPAKAQSSDEDESLASQKTGMSRTSSSSFSLQECIDEFRARKVHRSSQSYQNTDDDLINQNKSNKQNERIRNPCKDGFCYCFTSDSDDFRNKGIAGRSKYRRSDTTNEKISDVPKANHKVRRRETFPLNSRKGNNAKNGQSRKVTAISKLEDSSLNSKSPLIQIIQEIRGNCVVSEVRINKHKIPQNSSPVKNQTVTEKQVPNLQLETPIDLNSFAYVDHVSEIDSLAEKFKHSSLNTSSRSGDKNGGRLLQKRLSGSRLEYKPKNLSTPPKKPPRNITAVNSEHTTSSTTPSLRDAENILDTFLRQKGISVPQKVLTPKSKRKSYPLSKSLPTKGVESFVYKKPLPSCPSLSEIESLHKEKSNKNYGLIKEPELYWEDPKIKEMLNTDVKSKKFLSYKPECGPQVGWTVPQKLDIDTVDGGYHNLVANMEAKSTPIKTEIFSNKAESQKFILSEQLKSFVSNSPWAKKSKEKQNSFLNASKTKLLRFVANKSPSTSKTRSIGVQTTTPSTTNIQGSREKLFNAQSPPGSYFSNTPTKTSKSSQTEFDFSRTVHSPKRDKAPQRKLLFPIRNILRDGPAQKVNADKQLNQTYQSYNSELDKDLTLSKMGQVLSNIRNRLEASDDRAVGTFCDIQRKEAAAAALSCDCVDGYNYQMVYHTSAQADVHNEIEPSYSEIEEDSILVTGSPVTENTNGIEHFFVENNPAAIYAKVKKTPKKIKSFSNSFNNVMEQNSPPKLRNMSKTDLSVQSEIFLENLTSENNVTPNYSMDKVGKLHNIQQDEKSYSAENILDNSYASVDSFRESFAKESDVVSYELPDNNIYPINADNMTGNQSTPKKTIHLSKFDMKVTSDDAFGQTTSCPATPGWLSNDSHHVTPADESLSLCEGSTAISQRATGSSLWKYQTIKNKFHKSIRKGRCFLKNEKKRMSSISHFPKSLHMYKSWDESSLCIKNLFSMEDQTSVKDQLTQAVGLCRLIPDLEASPEMVEAERLLLVSTLKNGGKKSTKTEFSKENDSKGAITLNSLRLPIKANNEQELFFNYYYIGVFSDGKQIKSTQTAECCNGEAIFRNFNIFFDKLDAESEIHCDIFMLRLRKVINTKFSSSKRKKNVSASASTSSEEILSRFQPHASFDVRPSDFVPYHLIENSRNGSENYVCLHASNSYKFPIVPLTRSTNLQNEVQLSCEVEMMFTKFRKTGFLHIQDIGKQHNWNLRWCELDFTKLNIWTSPNDVSINVPTYIIDLCKCVSTPIQCASREMCARTKSFYLEIEDAGRHSKFYFSGDSQNDLNCWINALNEVLEFIAGWMK